MIHGMRGDKNGEKCDERTDVRRPTGRGRVMRILIFGAGVGRYVWCPPALDKRRHKAIELSVKGKPTIEIAHIVGATRRTVRRWKPLSCQNGVKGL